MGMNFFTGTAIVEDIEIEEAEKRVVTEDSDSENDDKWNYHEHDYNEKMLEFLNYDSAIHELENATELMDLPADGKSNQRYVIDNSKNIGMSNLRFISFQNIWFLNFGNLLNQNQFSILLSVHPVKLTPTYFLVIFQYFSLLGEKLLDVII